MKEVKCINTQIMNLLSSVSMKKTDGTTAKGIGSKNVTDDFEQIFQKEAAVLTEMEGKAPKTKEKEGLLPGKKSVKLKLVEKEPEPDELKMPHLLAVMKPDAMLNSLFGSGEQLERTLEITQMIVSILEGKNDHPDMKTASGELIPGQFMAAVKNHQNDTEIAPLLQELKDLFESDDALPAEILQNDAFAKEVKARMPATQDLITPAGADRNNLEVAADALRDYLCPFENVNDENPGQNSEKGLSDEQAGKLLKTDQKLETKTEKGESAFDISAHKAAFSERQSPEIHPAKQNARVSKEDMFETMVERITASRGETPHLKIALKPDHLGELSIDLVMHENGLAAKIKASDEGVRNILASQINSLTEALAEKGVKIASVDIVYTALNDRPFDRQSAGGQEQSRQNGRNVPKISAIAENRSAFMEPFYEMAYAGDMALSSVEYRA